jgi:hypothetical protein
MPQPSIDELMEIKTDLLRIQRLTLRTMARIDAMTAAIHPTATVPPEPTSMPQQVILYFQRRMARSLMEHATAAGARLHEDALGIHVTGDSLSDDDDNIVTWHDAVPPPPVARPRRSTRAPNPDTK